MSLPRIFVVVVVVVVVAAVVVVVAAAAAELLVAFLAVDICANQPVDRVSSSAFPLRSDSRRRLRPPSCSR